MKWYLRGISLDGKIMSYWNENGRYFVENCGMNSSDSGLKLMWIRYWTFGFLKNKEILGCSFKWQLLASSGLSVSVVFNVFRLMNACFHVYSSKWRSTLWQQSVAFCSRNVQPPYNRVAVSSIHKLITRFVAATTEPGSQTTVIKII